MNKEDILKLNRADTKGQLDEREKQVLGVSSRVGLIGGSIACFMLTFMSKFLLHNIEACYAGWVVYFAMLTSRNIVLYVNLKKIRDLFWGLFALAFAVIFVIALIMKWQVFSWMGH